MCHVEGWKANPAAGEGAGSVRVEHGAITVHCDSAPLAPPIAEGADGLDAGFEQCHAETCSQ